MVQPLANLLEPLTSRGSKVYRVISHVFGVVQLFRTCSNHTRHGNSPKSLVTSAAGQALGQDTREVSPPWGEHGVVRQPCGVRHAEVGEDW